MIRERLVDIANDILRYQPYFNAGYPDAYKDIDGRVIQDDELLFPADHLGDYFYLRVPETINFNVNSAFKVSDCADGGYQASASVILVACVLNADPDTLIKNLVNILRQTNKGYMLRNCINQSGVVIRRELAGLSNDGIKDALARLKEDTTIISITFDIAMPMTEITRLDCLPNPCELCQ